MFSSKNERLVSGKYTEDDDITSDYTTTSTTESDTDSEMGGIKTWFNWGWVVVLASFYCVAMVGGVGYITGVLMESLKTDLSGNIASISLAGSVQVYNEETIKLFLSFLIFWMN